MTLSASEHTRKKPGSALFPTVVFTVLLLNLVRIVTANGKSYDFSSSYAVLSDLLSLIGVLTLLAVFGKRLWMTTENVFESLVDMAAIDFPGHDHSWSILSDPWRPHQRLVGSPYSQVFVGIDNATESANCKMLRLREEVPK